MYSLKDITINSELGLNAASFTSFICIFLAHMKAYPFALF